MTPSAKMQALVKKDNLSDEGAERAVLASIMQDPSLMTECAIRLDDSDFINESNRYLYGIMLALFKSSGGKQLAFDITTLLSEAKQRGVEEQFIKRSGGEEYITFLTITKDMHINLKNFDRYVDKVLSFSVKRRLVESAEDFVHDIFAGELAPEELVVRGRDRIDGVFKETVSRTVKFSNLGGKAEEFVENAKIQKKEILGIRTLFPKLDKTIEGLRRQNLIIVSAPKKTGKSAFLMNIGLNVAIRQNIPTLMISTEMSDEEILSRSISNLSEVPEKDILKGNYSGAKAERVKMATEEMKNGVFFHQSMRDFNMEKVIAASRSFVTNIVGKDENGKTKDCLILFDYIKMPQAGATSSKEEKEYKVLGQFADALKILSGDLDIPILTACQTNRAGEVANSYELTWFCNTFMELTSKSDKELQNDLELGTYKGNQRLKIVDNRGGEEDHDGISLDYSGVILKYQELA